MIKKIKYFLLTSVALGFLQLETSAMEDERKDNDNPSISMKSPDNNLLHSTDKLSIIIKRAPRLELSSYSIDDDKACKLAEMLKDNTTLNYIDLNHNNIGNKGIKALAQSFKNLKSLTQLHLYGSPIDDEGFGELFPVLNELKSLSFIDIRATKLGSTGIYMFADLLKNNPKLTYHVSFNKSIVDEILK